MTPSTGVPGDSVAISGQGFGSQPEALVVWGRSGDTGLFFDIATAQDNLLQGNVGAVATPSTGTIEVWKGLSIALPDAVFEVAGGLVAVSETRVLLVQSQASGPSFSVLEESPLSVGSQLRNEKLILPFEGTLPCPGPSSPRPSITVDIVVQTNGPPGGGGTGEDSLLPPGLEVAVRKSESSGSGVAWAATFEVTVSSEIGCPPDLTHALTTVFEDRLGSLGLVAEVIGSEVVLSHGQGIEMGLALLTFP